MRGALASVALLAVVGTVVGCSQNGANTQIMVTVDAEPGVQRVSRHLLMRVYGGARGTPQADLLMVQEFPFVVADGVGWPSVVALAPLDRDSTRIYRVEASAYDVGAPNASSVPVATVRAISGYLPGQTLWLRLVLQDDCIGRTCADIQTTCEGGACVMAERPAESLPPWTADAGPGRDGGAMDAPVDMRDVGLDARADTSIDGGACTAAGCDDGLACTDDFCGALGCDHLPVDARCEDGQECTDDVCDPTAGCLHPPNAAGCDDGLFCNGLDHCDLGTCSGHASLGACAPLACDEDTDRCLDCSTSADCPSPTFGSFSACTYASACDPSGTQSRIVRTFECLSTVCVASDGPETRSCGTRSTEGVTCMASRCDTAGACSYPRTCATSGSAPETCHDFQCMGGTCTDTFYASSAPCTRPTDGIACDDGIACTSPDLCSGDVCRGGGTCDAGISDASSCSDGFACTDDVVGDAGCTFIPNDTFCDDAIGCSIESCAPTAPGHDVRGCVHDFSGCMPDGGGPRDGGSAPCVSMPSLCDTVAPCTIGSCMPSGALPDANGCVFFSAPCMDGSV